MSAKFKNILLIILGSILSFSLFYLVGFVISQIIFK